LTFLQTGRADATIPFRLPDGVITAWSVVPGTGTFPEKLVILHATGNPNEYTEVAESATESISSAASTFRTQIPVRAGDYIGAYGPAPSGTLICPGASADVVTYFAGDPGLGPPQTYSSNGSVLVDLSVNVEPDADRDGFGDETQDGCPQLHAVQATCPLIGLGSGALARKRWATLFVATDSDASVSVTATTKIPNFGKRTLLARRKQINLEGPVQSVSPGRVVAFKVGLPPRLKLALRHLRRSKYVNMTLTASATNVAGVPSQTSSTVKLRGTR